MRKRGLCCRPVSVCPSVTLVNCIHTAEDIVKLLVRLGTPSAGAQNTSGGEKLRFSTEIAVYGGSTR